LLGLLAQSPAHGYELYQRLSTDLSQVWHLSLSQTYNILKRLEAQGYIIGALQEQEKLPTRRLFRLTPSGQARFDRWLRGTCRSSVRAIRLEFLTRLYFARSADPQLAHQLIDAQLAETRRGLEWLHKKYSSLPEKELINRLGLELRIRQLESILEWLRDCHDGLNRAPVT
jgi:DNA-binding PadR family transcriptional regulator